MIVKITTLIILCCYAECEVFNCYAECHYDKTRYAWCRYVDCFYAKIRGVIIYKCKSFIIQAKKETVSVAFWIDVNCHIALACLSRHPSDIFFLNFCQQKFSKNSKTNINLFLWGCIKTLHFELTNRPFTLQYLSQAMILAPL